LTTITKAKIAIGITGASGAIYAKVLLDKLHAISEQWEAVGVVMSDNARTVWQYELESDMPDYPQFNFYKKDDFMAPIASGSAKYDTMIICPCSMGTLGRIAAGISNDLMTRAADVMLKERRKLILVARETPYSLIHLRNMETVTLAGGIICPATPSFYSRPKDFESLAGTVVDRVLDLAGFNLKSYRWGSDS
jgi:4-hydroxy-3-polyprenylbenzoate decarboxylase